MTRTKLHVVQQKLLDHLRAQQANPSTVRELQEIVGASSTSVVAHHLQQLERKGYIKRNPYNPRDFYLMEDGPEPDVAWLSVYGMAGCGPSGSILDGNPIDKIAIGSRLISFPARDAFLVRAKGRSMEPKILEGDLVIAQRSRELVDGRVYVCVNDQECLIKRVRSAGRGYILESFNSGEFPPFLAAEDLRLEGIVQSIISGHV
jgi:repressor LexA